MPTLKIFLHVEIKFGRGHPEYFLNISEVSRQILLAKALSLRFTVILLMILKLMILQNFTEAYSEPSRVSTMELFAKKVGPVSFNFGLLLKENAQLEFFITCENHRLMFVS